MPPLITPWKARAIGFGAAAVACVLVALFAPSWLAGTTRTVAAYDAAAIVLILFFWALGMHTNPQRTQARAELQDPGRNIVLLAVLVSVAVGLLAAVRILGSGSTAPTADEKHVAYVIAIVAVASGWFLIHTLFAFRYAHMYYFDDDDDAQADRGLTFPGTEEPSDFDFAYFSFVIGMTFQVSDVEITDPGVRRFVLGHALLSFAYNTAILAFGINVLSGLIKH